MSPAVQHDAVATFTGRVSPLCDAVTRWSQERGDEVAFTFMDFVADADGVARSRTWRQLDDRVRATAAHLQGMTRPGDRCAVLLPNGLDYVVGLLGAIRAGLVAVPLFPPGPARQGDHLAGILADCAPTAVLSSAAGSTAVRELIAGHEALARVAVVEMEQVGAGGGGAEVRATPVGPDTVAYLQYTSGSTRCPAGVMITHGNVVANVTQGRSAFDLQRVVSWLPLFHDMGLVLGVLLPTLSGLPSTLLDPMAFLQRPVRWLRLLGAEPGTLSAAPNFAFDYCVRRVREADRDGLRLDNIEAVINGSEPVRLETIERFATAFAGSGFRPSAHRPSFGLAEATVFVSTTGAAPTAVTVDREVLGTGSAVPVDPGQAAAGSTIDLVSCGRAVGQHLVPVDPDNAAPCPEGQVGELWCHGPNVGLGYWGLERPETFGATLHDPLGELPTGPWMRTGDLGVVLDGEVYVTGRLKDMVIIDGRNHYPQDIEATVLAAAPFVRSGYVAAFGVDTRDGEGLVVVAGGRSDDPTGVRRAVRRAVSEQHGISVHDFVLVPSGRVPRTSSGKIIRSACRKLYLAGELTRAVG